VRGAEEKALPGLCTFAVPNTPPSHADRAVSHLVTQRKLGSLGRDRDRSVSGCFGRRGKEDMSFFPRHSCVQKKHMPQHRSGQLQPQSYRERTLSQLRVGTHRVADAHGGDLQGGPVARGDATRGDASDAAGGGAELLHGVRRGEVGVAVRC
jgi:hypothetical protein